ncbi:MAG: hypothetical protein D8M58_13335 [Calditrichaeota bacterium]|nr:MAG: hypothetical protein DWQ03_00300 [Calditrichota bacterium]MBL1206381.1 hypothetical protein [Calditrichota bacterium]NOG46207.1 hypothetical protein [Calditrichota bacterium]
MKKKQLTYFTLSGVIFLIGSFVIIDSFVLKKEIVSIPVSEEKCLTCHTDMGDPSPFHPIAAYGCVMCHLGNASTDDKDDAHEEMLVNPSDLNHADLTCGKCHNDILHNVRNSIMTNNAGLVASTLYQWDERISPDDTSLHINELPDTSLATSHMRKLCAGCHVNKLENDLPGETGTRGGGCNDCHLVKAGTEGKHSTFSVQMDIPVCEKCHNRSDRVGLTYQGKFESEGYGTPYEHGNTSSMELSNGRYFYQITPDIHYEAGMVCIDCHIAEDVMGDGKKYTHLELAVHIKCEDCHQMKTARPPADNIVWRMIEVNSNLQLSPDSTFAKTERNSFYANVFMEDEDVVLIRKLDGQKLIIPQNKNRPECQMPGHEKMSCQACHSAYTPQCYGCHDVYDPTKKQLDKVSYEETYGHWSEGRSYLRFEKPTLGIDNLGRIIPFAPGCQVYMTELDDDLQIKQQKTWLTMAPYDPHSTRKNVATCIDCHGSIKRFGLGEGNVQFKDGLFTTQQIYDAPSSGLGNFSLETMIDENGEIPQKMSRKTARPFSLDEIKKIYRVSLCITCHDSYKDKIYKDFDRSIEYFKSKKNKACQNYFSHSR